MTVDAPQPLTTNPPVDPGGSLSNREDIVRNIKKRSQAKAQRRRRERWMLPTGLILALFAIWEIYGQIRGFNPLFFAAPSDVFRALGEYAKGALWSDLAVSGQEFGFGMLIALSGIPLGLVIGRSQRLVETLNPVIDALYTTPILALTPLFIIWFGLGLQSKIAIVAVIAFFPLIITIIEGVKTVNGPMLSAARTFGASKIDLYVDVILPSLVPFIVSGLRLSIRAGVIGVVLGEFIGAMAGVGYHIRVFAAAFQTASYLGGVLVLVTIAVGLNRLLKFAERRLAPWQNNIDDH